MDEPFCGGIVYGNQAQRLVRQSGSQGMKLHSNAYRILVALALAAGALWIFAEVVEEVFFEGDIVLDKAILRGLHSPLDPAIPLGPAWLVSVARDVTALGSFTVITILTIAVVVFPLMARQRPSRMRSIS